MAKFQSSVQILRKASFYITSLFCILIAVWSGCSGQSSTPQSGKKAEPVIKTATVSQTPNATLPAFKNGVEIMLAQAQFDYQKDESGKERPIPGAARLVIFRNVDGKWNEDLLEDPDSNVFHKAIAFKPPVGEPGILTIGAGKALVKIWRRSADQWTSETLWNPTFGGKFDRLRDIEIADLTGDGFDDLAIVTHDQGVVAVLVWSGTAYEPLELTRLPNTFVHEVEIGDVDGDGLKELFTTPSLPNKLDGSVQPGEIDMFKYVNGKWVQSKVDTLESRHAKEVLCVTLDSEKNAVLFASLEGEKIGGPDAGDTTRIRLYRYVDGAFTHSDITSLPGRLCRFLNYGDTDGDGKRELIASTKGDGIFKITPVEGTQWPASLIASETSGFEHATFLADLNADNRQEIVVASDDQREMRIYQWDGTRYTKSVIGTLKKDTITFNVTVKQE